MNSTGRVKSEGPRRRAREDLVRKFLRARRSAAAPVRVIRSATQPSGTAPAR